MLELMTPKDRAKHAHTMAASFELVRYKGVTYIPAHFETGDTSSPPAPAETMWLPIDRTGIQRLARDQYDMLFGTDGELSGFDFMVAQNCHQVDDTVTSLLVRTEEGLRRLNGSGVLKDPTGDFVPNTILPMLNDDDTLRKEVFSVIAEWVDSEDEARALLRHLATCLAPGWSAVKYLLFLGEGRNGKSVLLKMVQHLFGRHNVSNVTRQSIAEKSPAVLDLNGKLVNIVYDGQEEYLKDSGAEKTLIAGEPFGIRRLYESTATLVQTNALFIEGLQKEPKSKDKSTALQKRLVRFQFPNVYAQDNAFEKHMLSEPILGAFLGLLIEHYVHEHEVAVELAPTEMAMALQLEHMYANSLALQFLKHVEETDPLGVAGAIVGETLHQVIQRFQSWRIKENDLGSWSEPDVAAQLQPLVTTERKSAREAGKVVKIRTITSLKPEAKAFIDTLKGDEDGSESLVED
jgi:hypothetical protein